MYRTVGNDCLPFFLPYELTNILSLLLDAMPNVVVRRFGAREIAPEGQEVESEITS